MHISKSIEDAMRSETSLLAETIQSFLRARHDLGDKSRRDYGASLSRFDTFLGGARLADLTADNANRYIESKRKHRYVARLDCATLKVFSRWLVRSKILASDPLANVGTPRVPKAGREPLPDGDIPKILRVAQETKAGARDFAIMLLYVTTAMRPNELRQIRWPEDVDLDLGRVHVRGETSKTGMHASEADRWLLLNAQTIAAIDRYVKDYRPLRSGPLFLNRAGEPFTYFGFLALNQRLRTSIERQGVRGFMVYRLRHTALTNAARIPGYTAFDIQQMAGHKRIETTQRYVRKGKSLEELRRLPDPFTAIYGRAI